MDYYAALMKIYGWTLDQIDGTELEFLLDMIAIQHKKEQQQGKKKIGNADDVPWL